MNVFIYRDIDSFLHKLDPRTKLLATLTFFVYALMFRSITLQSIIFIVLISYISLGRLVMYILRIKFFLLLLFVNTVLMWLLTIRGSTTILLWFSIEGLLYGISTGISLLIMIISSIAFIATTKVEEITVACIRFGLSYRLAFSISTTIRMISTITNTGVTILQAQASRGLNVESGKFVQKMKNQILIILPIIISIIRDTTIFAMALESKGFGYSNERVYYVTIAYKPLDYICSIVFLLLMVLAVLIKAHYGL